MTDWLSPPEIEAILLSLKWLFGPRSSVCHSVLLLDSSWHGSISRKTGFKWAGSPSADTSSVVTGFILLKLFGTQGPIGSVLKELGIVIAFSWTGAALACSDHGISADGTRHPVIFRNHRFPS